MPIVDIFAAFKWWLALMILGIIALPLAQLLLHRLPDRGYAFVKMIGLLIVSFIFWILGSLGFLGNNLSGIIFSVAALGALSFWAIKENQRTDENFSSFSWVKQNWKYVLTAELLFTVIFVFWVWVRAQNPAISGTEKPMEFAFLNSIGRSPTFPPVDPWLSGFSISYYYFGYVMSSVIGRLAAVSEPLGFNLAIVWLTAATSLGAFGLVYNLVVSGMAISRKAAVMAALIAGIALPIAGNMEILLEVTHAGGLGSDEFWEWLDVRELNEPALEEETPRFLTSQWWWWRSSRVIHEYHISGTAEEGLEPIAEFPAFSFILGDLHPHVLALPFAFLSLALALAWWLRTDRLGLNFRSWFSKNGLGSQIKAISNQDKTLIIFTGLLLGGLSFLNTWDVLIHMFVILGAFFLVQWRLNGKWERDLIFQTATLAFFIILLAFLLYLPFYIGFRSQAAPPFLLPMIMRPTRLPHFLIIFGMPLIAVVLLLGTLLFNTVKSRKETSGKNLGIKIFAVVVALIVGLFLVTLLLGFILAASQEGGPRVANLADEFDVQLSPFPQSESLGARIAWAIPSIMALAPNYLLSRLSNPFLILFLALLIGISVYLIASILKRSEGEEDNGSSKIIGALPFVLLLILTASLLTITPEFVYLRDNFGQRLNTVFKFYYQAWILFGISALYGIDYLWRHFRFSGIVAVVAYGLALVISLLFPWYAIKSRAIEYRGPLDSEERLEATLDGLAYLERNDQEEKEIINWLSNNVEGVPVIVEAVGGQYSAFGRIASSTGLPTLLGWPGHEYQWRGSTPEPAAREIAIKTIYESTDLEETKRVLNQYNVSFIVYGPRERSTYSPSGLDKFDQYFEVAYRNNGITVYRWQPQ
jgi:YYY domain-containing protein